METMNLLVGALIVVFSVLVFFWMTRHRRGMLKLGRYVFVGVVVFGFGLYLYCYLTDIKQFSVSDFPNVILRGIFDTGRMFFIDTNYGDLAGVVPEDHPWEDGIVIAFLVLHVLAMFVVQVTLISVFGRKIIDELRLGIFGFHKKVYIINGSDKNAFTLGENIATCDGTKKFTKVKDRLVVFLLNEDDDEKIMRDRAESFGAIVQTPEGKVPILTCLKKCIGRKRRKNYKIILMPNNNISVSNEVFCIVDYAQKLRISKDNLEIFAFTSSEWEREMIKEMTTGKTVCQYTIHIVNETDLFVRQMIAARPPYERMNFTNGKAKRNFNVMIIGFGTVGQSALLRLVMNGQFVVDGDEKKRMRAIIVDKNIDELQDCFLHRYPALHLCCDMEFKNYDAQCDALFDYMKDEQAIDYIVVALNDGETNKRVALDIRQLYLERRNFDMPVIAVFEKSGQSYEPIKNVDSENGAFFVFGCREDIYKESVIINEALDKRAKCVNSAYNEKCDPQYAKQWHELDWWDQESNRASADFIYAQLKIAGVSEKEAQEKNTLAEESSELAETLAQTEHLRWNAFHAAMGWRPITIEEMRKRFNDFGDLALCRKDTKAKLHVCFADWDELGEIDKTYVELQRAAGKENPKSDFKEYDRGIVRRIPEYLKIEAGTNG